MDYRGVDNSLNQGREAVVFIICPPDLKLTKLIILYVIVRLREYGCCVPLFASKSKQTVKSIEQMFLATGKVLGINKNLVLFEWQCAVEKQVQRLKCF